MMVTTEVSEKNGYCGCVFEWGTLEEAMEFTKKVITAMNGSAHEVKLSISGTETISDKDGDEQW